LDDLKYIVKYYAWDEAIESYQTQRTFSAIWKPPPSIEDNEEIVDRVLFLAKQDNDEVASKYKKLCFGTSYYKELRNNDPFIEEYKIANSHNPQRLKQKLHDLF